MKVSIKAKSSSGGSYDVEFLSENESFSVHCTCKAGIVGNLCRHRRGLLMGDETMLVDPSQSGDLAIVVEWGRRVGLDRILRTLETCEEEFSRASKEVTNLKRLIEEGLRNGLNRHLLESWHVK